MFVIIKRQTFVLQGDFDDDNQTLTFYIDQNGWIHLLLLNDPDDLFMRCNFI